VHLLVYGLYRYVKLIITQLLIKQGTVYFIVRRITLNICLLIMNIKLTVVVD